ERREVARERLVGRDRVIGVAARDAYGRGDLVAVGEAHADPCPDAETVVGGHVLVREVRLIVEAFVAKADVAEGREVAQPVGGLHRLGLRHLGVFGRLLDLLPLRPGDRLFLLDLLAELLHLLLELAQAAFRRALSPPRDRCEPEHGRDHERGPAFLPEPPDRHAILSLSICVPPVAPVSGASSRGRASRCRVGRARGPPITSSCHSHPRASPKTRQRSRTSGRCLWSTYHHRSRLSTRNFSVRSTCTTTPS